MLFYILEFIVSLGFCFPLSYFSKAVCFSGFVQVTATFPKLLSIPLKVCTQFWIACGHCFLACYYDWALYLLLWLVFQSRSLYPACPQYLIFSFLIRSWNDLVNDSHLLSTYYGLGVMLHFTSATSIIIISLLMAKKKWAEKSVLGTKSHSNKWLCYGPNKYYWNQSILPILYWFSTKRDIKSEFKILCQD